MDSTARARPRGEIVTFYSYKGGTGRTMALANVACLLAERAAPGDGILVVDWDLEAPGLHRFFPGRLGQPPSDAGLGLDASKGVIDLFLSLDEALPDSPAESESAADAAADAAISTIAFEEFIGESGIPRVQILRAGRNDDGQYSRRVNTFNWEGLFRRAPSIYRRLAERLAGQFRYVLIDSRTGVTDISGICTSLLPEKLVVVFTPNRQSLTGIQELVERATSYRRRSDDLRPLLIYPLPSRIEASLQDLRAQWRFGSRDHNLPGYQPMFEDLFARAYGLERCDLSAYFDDVQIQQTPDYAYGEEIAVRRASDRFSLANSYRVFVDRLGDTPWAAPAAEQVQPMGSSRQSVSPRPSRPPAAAAPPSPVSSEERGSARPTIFLAYAREDRERVAPVARALEANGWNVWFDVNIPAGVAFDRSIADALDTSSAIVVFWSTSSVVSRWVLDEAAEGLRRGILVPVLIDDVAPPLAFRSVQSADLRREDSRSLNDLVRAVGVVAQAMPGTTLPPSVQASAQVSAPRLSRKSVALAAGSLAAAVLLFAVFTGAWFGTASSPSPSDSAAAPSVTPTVPDFVGARTSDVQRTAALLGVSVEMRGSNGERAPFIEGIVQSQSPPPGAALSLETPIELVVASSSVAVPTVVGTTVEAALRELQSVRLELGTTTFRTVTDVEPGKIVEQMPSAGVLAAVGTTVDVVVATRVMTRTTAPTSVRAQESRIPPPTTRPPGQNEAERQRRLMLDAVQRYEAAFNSGSIDQIVRVYPTIPADDREKLRRTLSDCRLQLDDLQPRTRAGEEVALVTAKATYSCMPGSSAASRTIPQTFQLRPAKEGWLIAGIAPQ